MVTTSLSNSKYSSCKWAGGWTNAGVRKTRTLFLWCRGKVELHPLAFPGKIASWVSLMTKVAKTPFYRFQARIPSGDDQSRVCRHLVFARSRQIGGFEPSRGSTAGKASRSVSSSWSSSSSTFFNLTFKIFGFKKHVTDLMLYLRSAKATQTMAKARKRYFIFALKSRLY